MRTALQIGHRNSSAIFGCDRTHWSNASRDDFFFPSVYDDGACDSLLRPPAFAFAAILASFRHLWGSDHGGGGDETSQDGCRCLG